MKLLIVAAIPMELSAFPAALRRDAVLVANGAGVKRAAAAVDSALFIARPDAIVSTGFCGALDESMKIGDIVVGTDPGLPVECARPAHRGRVITIDHIARTKEEKRALRASGAIAVDMEAAGVASRAAAHSLPFYCIRAVTDLASEDMANDFNAALRSDGHFATMLILRGALRHPIARFPELLRLRSRSIRAARVLGDFFADCRF